MLQFGGIVFSSYIMTVMSISQLDISASLFGLLLAPVGAILAWKTMRGVMFYKSDSWFNRHKISTMLLVVFIFAYGLQAIQIITPITEGVTLPLTVAVFHGVLPLEIMFWALAMDSQYDSEMEFHSSNTTSQ